MNCFKTNDIYDYLEGSLPLERREELERHLSACPRCRGAVEDRELIAGAAASLPPFAVPDDFTDRVMARIAPATTRLPAWLIGLASFSSLVALTSIILIASGRSVVGIFVGASHSFWGYAKNAAVLTAKAATLLSLALKTVESLLASAAKGLSLATSVLSPGLLVVILVLITVLVVGLALGTRKKISLGD